MKNHHCTDISHYISCMKNICLPSQHTQWLPKAYFGSFGSEMCDQAPMMLTWCESIWSFTWGHPMPRIFILERSIKACIILRFLYIYIIVIPNKMEKVIHHQITRDLLIYLFGDEHTCFPTWPCEVSITIHIGDMVVKRNIWLIELKPPIYLSSNRPKSIICPDSSPFTHHFPWVFFNFPSIPSIFPPFSHPFSLHFLNRVPVPGDDARAADPRRPGLRARLQQRPAAGGAGELPSEQRLGRMGIRRDDGILQLRHGSN